MSSVVGPLRADDVLELLEPEVEDVVLLAKHAGLDEALGFLQQGLLVHEVAADHAVLRILPVPDEGADPVDLRLHLFGLPLPVRQGPQARPAAPAPSALASCRPCSKRRSPAPGSKFSTLPRMRGTSVLGRSLQRGLVMSISPTPAHAVLVEPGPGWRLAPPARPRAWPARPGSPRPRRAPETPPRPDAGGSRRRRPGAPAPSPR